ncbi:hypothetical protein ACLESO_11210 [Pyxidicoccus sp. 3LG]
MGLSRVFDLLRRPFHSAHSRPGGPPRLAALCSALLLVLALAPTAHASPARRDGPRARRVALPLG